MIISDFKGFTKRLFSDSVVCLTVAVITIISFILSYFSLSLGLEFFTFFVIGCAITTVLIRHQYVFTIFIEKIQNLLGCKEESINGVSSDCDVCGTTKCRRHRMSSNREQSLLIEEHLDEAIGKFYNGILDNFISSWFSLISKDKQFTHLIKDNVREASCRLIIKIKELNAPLLLTNKLLPCFFTHYELVSTMLENGIAMDKLAITYVMNDRSIHPATINRKAEMEYLREIAKCLIPKLMKSENYDSKILFSLIREILTNWVLLPLLDVLADPNLLNQLVILATNPSSGNKYKNGKNVMFLEKFAGPKIEKTLTENKNNDIVDFLKDQKQLYCFMQFLKKCEAVDVLQFYMDVDNLNNDLSDPKLTTDPAKLSSLYQQSEKLLTNYQAMMKINNQIPVNTLGEAHEHVKIILQDKWRKEFYRTSEYFKLLYGNRDIDEELETKTIEANTGTVSKLSSKIKGAIRGTVDGTPIVEAIPTVWDAFVEPQIQSHTIYSSVTQKLRKEKGQNLDPFMSIFMQSVDQIPADFGEDVIKMKDRKFKLKNSKHPGNNLVFGDLFEMKSQSQSTTIPIHCVKGPSQCFIYILIRFCRAPSILVRLATAVCSVSKKAVDSLICKIILHFIKQGLHESRLASLINLLHDMLFNNIKTPEPTPHELLKRQQLARSRMESTRKGLGNLADCLQSPPLNKHIIYCLFDIILAEIYPEFDDTKLQK